MRYSFVLLIICASCTFKKSPSPAKPELLQRQTDRALSEQSPSQAPLLHSDHPVIDKELEKITRWFEQMDAVSREALWVVKKERPPLGKSIFGKMQRALLVETKQRLSNKSLFSCDVYSMSRTVTSVTGVPQTAESFHRCNSREGFAKFGDWKHLKANELEVNFQASNLSEVLGVATGIFNPKIHCQLKSNDAGIIQTFSCENLMMDYNPAKNQVLKFKRFEFSKVGQQVLHLNADVLENLEAMRKIEADVPIDGAILVTETVLKAPYVAPKTEPVPSPTIPPPLIQAGSETAGAHGTQSGPQAETGSIERAPGPPGVRGTRPVPAEVLGTRGAPVISIPGQEPGEYHEGGPLPGEQSASPQQGPGPLMPSEAEVPGVQEGVPQQGGALPPGVEPMPPMSNER
jgi:hypothetical protein